MKTATAKKDEAPVLALTKADPKSPVLIVTGPANISIKGGATIDLDGVEYNFAEQTEITLPQLVVGGDYGIAIDDTGALVARHLTDAGGLDGCFAGFHYGPGALATARQGGGDTPTILEVSLWDLRFRPACPDPRGMALVANSPGAPDVKPFWLDLYLTAQDHLGGTSRFGAVIADGRNWPQKLEGGGRFGDCNYHTANAILAHHGKAVPSLMEFFAGAYGVTEKSASGERREATGLDALRTSRFVYMATGQRWIWGHDGDPDTPRASIFGGSYWVDGNAGSRYAYVDDWPELSSEGYGCRGRSDHLELA